MTATPNKKRIGRPMKAATPGTRVGLGLRVKADTKARLIEGAKANSRSLSQEAEMRIERSFRDDEIIERLARIERALIGTA